MSNNNTVLPVSLAFSKLNAKLLNCQRCFCDWDPAPGMTSLKVTLLHVDILRSMIVLRLYWIKVGILGGFNNAVSLEVRW
jgi:hypothetical protein